MWIAPGPEEEVLFSYLVLIQCPKEIMSGYQELRVAESFLEKGSFTVGRGWWGVPDWKLGRIFLAEY